MASLAKKVFTVLSFSYKEIMAFFFCRLYINNIGHKEFAMFSSLDLSNVSASSRICSRSNDQYDLHRSLVSPGWQHGYINTSWHGHGDWSGQCSDCSLETIKGNFCYIGTFLPYWHLWRRSMKITQRIDQIMKHSLVNNLHEGQKKTFFSRTPRGSNLLQEEPKNDQERLRLTLKRS